VSCLQAAHQAGFNGALIGSEPQSVPHQTTMGLGYAIDILPDGTEEVGHDGANDAWIATFASLTERGEGIVILTKATAARRSASRP
jgi:hypothetical protein